MIGDTLTSFFVVASRRRGNPLKSQDEEGFYILICHFDFLCLIFDILLDLVLGI